VTTPRKTPAGPGPYIPHPRSGDKNQPEIEEPYDLPFPGPLAASRPEYVIVVDQLRDWQPGLPRSLAELLKTRPVSGRDPEPDLEAEP
jgi:hypothetical protein